MYTTTIHDRPMVIPSHAFMIETNRWYVAYFSRRCRTCTDAGAPVGFSVPPDASSCGSTQLGDGVGRFTTASCATTSSFAPCSSRSSLVGAWSKTSSSFCHAEALLFEST